MNEGDYMEETEESGGEYDLGWLYMRERMLLLKGDYCHVGIQVLCCQICRFFKRSQKYVIRYDEIYQFLNLVSF